MPSFILETYVPRLSSAGLGELIGRTKRATTGTAVVHVRSYFVPEDDMCMHVFEATSAADVHEVASRAQLEIERIVQSLGEDTEPTTERNP